VSFWLWSDGIGRTIITIIEEEEEEEEEEEYYYDYYCSLSCSRRREEGENVCSSDYARALYIVTCSLLRRYSLSLSACL